MIFRHDEQLMIKNKKNIPVVPPPVVATPIATTQFGASLQFIRENNDGEFIPPIVIQCIEFLDTPDGKRRCSMSLIDKCTERTS